MARQSSQVKKTSKATNTSSQRNSPISSKDQNVTTSPPRSHHLNAEFVMETTEMYFSCIDEQYRLMELLSLSSVTNSQDRQQVVQEMISAGKGSLEASIVQFIKGLQHIFHYIGFIISLKAKVPENTPFVRVHQFFLPGEFRTILSLRTIYFVSPAASFSLWMGW